MGFHAITAAFQAQINEHQDRPVTQDMIDDIEEILEEYCATLEKLYGLGLSFDLDVNEDDGRLKYSVMPDTEFDGMLLARITDNESQVAPTTMRLQ